MDREPSSWPPLPGDAEVMRAPAMTYGGVARLWPFAALWLLLNGPVILAVSVNPSGGDLIAAIVWVIALTGVVVLWWWGYRRRFVRLHQWQVTVCLGLGRTRSADLRATARARFERNGAHCRLRFPEHARSISVPLDHPEFREAFLSRLALVPGVDVRGRLRTELESHRK